MILVLYERSGMVNHLISVHDLFQFYHTCLFIHTFVSICVFSIFTWYVILTVLIQLLTVGKVRQSHLQYGFLDNIL